MAVLDEAFAQPMFLDPPSEMSPEQVAAWQAAWDEAISGDTRVRTAILARVRSAELNQATGDIYAYRCPTPCDSDCEARCHEGHEVSYKQRHNVAECQARRAAAEAYARFAPQARCRSAREGGLIHGDLLAP